MEGDAPADFGEQGGEVEQAEGGHVEQAGRASSFQGSGAASTSAARAATACWLSAGVKSITGTPSPGEAEGGGGMNHGPFGQKRIESTARGPQRLHRIIRTRFTYSRPGTARSSPVSLVN